MEYNFIISYQSGKKNDKADALTQKPNERPVDGSDDRLKYCMLMLLPPKHFEYAINLQPIAKDAKNAKPQIPNENMTNALDLAEPHAKHSTVTLSEEVQNANRIDDLCTRICAYLKAPDEIAKLAVYVNSCRIINGLLMKADCLWVPKGKNK